MSAYFECPQCGFPENRVIDSRPSKDSIRRRRECIECGFRWTTWEYSEKKQKTEIVLDVKEKVLEFLMEIRGCVDEAIAKVEQKGLENGD